MFGNSRRDFLRHVGITATASATGSTVTGSRTTGAEAIDIEDSNGGTTVTVTKGTNVAATTAPDGESLVIDLHGFLFRLPVEGGEAERLTDAKLEPARPDYAPNGDRIAFQAYADGAFDIWTIAPDGSDVIQLTDGLYDDRDPRWSPDGNRIAFSSDRGGSYDIWMLDVDTGTVEQWTDGPNEKYAPTWSPDGTEIAYVTDRGTKIEAATRNGEVRTLIEASSRRPVDRPSWSPDGDGVAYLRNADGEIDLMGPEGQLTSGEDVFVFTPEWSPTGEILYTANGDIRRLDPDDGDSSDVPFSATFRVPEVTYERKSHDFDDESASEVRGIVSPTLAPDGERVAFCALNDLWVMPIGRPPRRITDDSFYQADPAWSPDGRYLAYSSDKDGTQDLYVHDTESGTDRRLTSTDGAAVSAAWSPDGSRIAFQNQNGATLVVEVETGEIRDVHGPLVLPGRPTWSPDGETIAMTALKSYSDRFPEGTNQILTVDVETGEATYHPPDGEHSSISTRGYDGPVWSPDGNWMATVIESALHVIPVDETGEPTGSAKQITDEVTDAPTWGGDSEWLLYLNNGRLKKVRRDGSAMQEVPVPGLRYRRDHPAGRRVIYAGRMWDGTSPDVHENVVIQVVGNRIKSVEPDSEPPSGPYVDASDLTVIPGLWDAHVHQASYTNTYGERQGRLNLAYGVTSTLSVGDLVYDAIEEREVMRSGDRVGPRYFACGELIDGARINYSTNRPTTSTEQLTRELSRARELEYDYLKTYVRLNAERMAEVAEVAHEDLGVPSGSHLFSPGVFVGQDGTTHLSATQRLDFARTESGTNRTYDDVVELYGRGNRSVTTTFFTTDFLLAEEVENDPRTQLFPPWERESLFDAVAGNTEFPSDPGCETVVCRNATALGDIAESGGEVLVGTDAPLDYVGLAVHQNLRPLAEYALSPHEALLAATRRPAEHLGVDEDIGTLESDKLADMVFVEGNPLDRISDALQVRMTMKNGDLFTVDELVGPFADEDVVDG